MRGAYETPTETCPYCGTECEAEFADSGIGMMQVTPYVCQECLAYIEGIKPVLTIRRRSQESTGWYAPPDCEPTEQEQGLIPIPDGYAEA